MVEKQVIRGLVIDPEKLETIRNFVQLHWNKGRTEISKALCRHWNWKQPNGWLKDRACRDILLALNRQGTIELPQRQTPGTCGKKIVQPQRSLLEALPLEGSISEHGSLTITMVRKSASEKLWDQLVHQYHYLGNPHIVGSYLKYLAFLQGQVVACLGWGSAAWRVSSRDCYIGWEEETRKHNLHNVVNNVRFLVLPWVKVPHLASKVLAANLKHLCSDWMSFYHVPLWMAETFVDSARFQGTCYKAANWVHVGSTAGSAKKGASYHYHGQPKAVFVYPLHKKFRERLHG